MKILKLHSSDLKSKSKPKNQNINDCSVPTLICVNWLLFTSRRFPIQVYVNAKPT